MPKHLRAYTLRSTLFFGLLALLGAAACDDSTTTNNGTPTGPSLDGGADVTPSGDPADPTPDEILSGGSCPAPSGAGTDHAGIVSADETWTAAGSPHRVTSALDIRANITIEPCARVVVSNTSISVGTDSNAGSLTARGTSQLVDGKKDVRPILFEAADKTQGWVQLGVYPKGKVDLSIAAIVDGGGESSGESGALLAKGVAGGTNDGEITRNLTVDRVVIERSKSYGVHLDGWGTFTEASNKLWIQNGGSAKLPSAIRLEPGIASTLPKTIALTGNVRDEILVRTNKTFMPDDTFVDRGVPYHVVGLLRVSPGKDNAPPVKLTIEAGVTLGFDAAVGAGIFVGDSQARQGVLQAVGTADKPIVFTSAAATKAAGDWAGLYFHSSPPGAGKISHARIEYAGAANQSKGFGCGPADNASAIFVEGFGPQGVGPSADFIQSTTFDNIGGTTVIVSGWVNDDGPNLTNDNTFGTSVPSCKVSKPRRTGAGDVCDGGRTTCW